MRPFRKLASTLPQDQPDFDYHLKIATRHALEVLEDLTELMQNQFEEVRVNKQTQEREYIFLCTGMIEKYEEKKELWNILHAYYQFQENKEERIRKEQEVQQAVEKVNDLKRRIESSTGPQENLFMEIHDHASFIQSLQRELHEIDERRIALEGFLGTTKSALKQRISYFYSRGESSSSSSMEDKLSRDFGRLCIVSGKKQEHVLVQFIDEGIGKTRRRMTQCQDEANFLRLRLSDQLELMTSRYDEIQKIRYFCSAMEAIYGRARQDETRDLQQSFARALEICQFSEMAAAIKAYERLVRERPLVGDVRDPIVSRPEWNPVGFPSKRDVK